MGEGRVVSRVLRNSILTSGFLVGLIAASPAFPQSLFEKTPFASIKPTSDLDKFAAVDADAATASNRIARSSLSSADVDSTSALGYAKRQRPAEQAPPLAPPPPVLPAVDGINGKIAGFGGGANHTSDLYGGAGALSLPLAQRYGLQIDGGIGSVDGATATHVASRLFWRDPSVSLLGAYGSYSHRDGVVGVSISRAAAEGEYYLPRWTFGGLLGAEMVDVNRAFFPNGIPTRFFDELRASYYVTDNFALSIGHIYSFSRHGLALGGEYGMPMGGGRMASLFAEGLLGEGGKNAIIGGLRIYFGQRDKMLIDRHRQDDPIGFIFILSSLYRFWQAKDPNPPAGIR
jgi:hypothetical protein